MTANILAYRFGPARIITGIAGFPMAALAMIAIEPADTEIARGVMMSCGQGGIRADAQRGAQDSSRPLGRMIDPDRAASIRMIRIFRRKLRMASRQDARVLVPVRGVMTPAFRHPLHLM